MTTKEIKILKFADDLLCYSRIMLHLLFTFEKTGDGKIPTFKVTTLMYYYWIHVNQFAEISTYKSEWTNPISFLNEGLKKVKCNSEDKTKTWKEVEQEIRQKIEQEVVEKDGKTLAQIIIEALADADYIIFEVSEISEEKILSYYNQNLIKKFPNIGKNDTNLISYGYRSYTYPDIYIVLLYLFALDNKVFQFERELILTRLFYVLSKGALGHTKKFAGDKRAFDGLDSIFAIENCNYEYAINKISNNSQMLSTSLFNISKHFHEIANKDLAISESAPVINAYNIQDFDKLICRIFLKSIECEADDMQSKFIAPYKVNSILKTRL